MNSDDRDSIETQLAVLQNEVKHLSAQIGRVINDHEERLRRVEASDRRWAIAAVLVAGTVTVLLKLLFNL